MSKTEYSNEIKRDAELDWWTCNQSDWSLVLFERLQKVETVIR